MGECRQRGLYAETLIALVRHESRSRFLGRRLRALGLRFPRQCSLSDFFDLPAATGFGYQKKSSPTMGERCCSEPNHTGFPTLAFYFVELNLFWSDHQKIRRVNALVRNAESDGFICPIRDRSRLFRGFQMLRILFLPGTPVAQRPLRWFRHND